jgi:hypothetical protein
MNYIVTDKLSVGNTPNKYSEAFTVFTMNKPAPKKKIKFDLIGPD